MGVNVASFVRYFLCGEHKTIASFIIPLSGFCHMSLSVVKLRLAGKDSWYLLAISRGVIWSVENLVAQEAAPVCRD